jgi:hypothetical protein
MKAYDFKVLLESDETDGYVATCPIDGALDNIREAIELAWRTLCSVQALRARRTCSARRSLMRDW